MERVVDGEVERGSSPRDDEAQRLVEMGRVASKVGHECNNLMAIILAATEFLAEDLDPDSPLIADVKMIEDAARRATILNRKLLRRG